MSMIGKDGLEGKAVDAPAGKSRRKFLSGGVAAVAGAATMVSMPNVSRPRPPP